MKVITVFYLILIVAQNIISQKIHKPFDYFKLVMQWPPGFCVPKSKRSRIPKKFTIHDIVGEAWTCSIELYKQKAYFDLAIKLYDLYNITKIF
ncbi:hypothetical protein M9H77_00239 [Catharanthus roseus]|nr:hypothetical protein M9H77_00239 [Catharanthus roseus]